MSKITETKSLFTKVQKMLFKAFFETKGRDKEIKKKQGKNEQNRQENMKELKTKERMP